VVLSIFEQLKHNVYKPCSVSVFRKIIVMYVARGCCVIRERGIVGLAQHTHSSACLRCIKKISLLTWPS